MIARRQHTYLEQALAILTIAGAGAASIPAQFPDRAANAYFADAIARESDGQIVFPIVRTGGSRSVEIDVRIVAGTAEAGTDFVDPGVVRVTFPSGSSTQYVTIDLVDDDVAEEGAPETISIELVQSLGSQYDLNAANLSAQGTIVDDDSATDAVYTIAGSTVEQTGEARIYVARTGSLADTFTADYATGIGTASAGIDYLTRNGQITIQPETWLTSFVLPVLDESLHEENQTFAVEFSNASGGTLSNPDVTCTIIDDDPTPYFSIVSLAPGSEESGFANAVVRKRGHSEVAATMEMQFYSMGEAIPGTDFDDTNIAFDFGPDDYFVEHPIPIYQDSEIEGLENFGVEMSAATWANGDTTPPDSCPFISEATIHDDDTVQSRFSFASDVVVNEDAGSAVFTITLSPPVAAPTSVRVLSQQTGAAFFQDYRFSSPTVSFSDGQTTATVEVEITDDTIDEFDEHFVVYLRSPEGAGVGAKPFAKGTIIDNDAEPVVGLPNDSETTEGQFPLNYEIALTSQSDKGIGLTWEIEDGSATGGFDTVQRAGRITSVPYETAGDTELRIEVVDDNFYEGTEAFTLNLSNPGNSTLGDSTATGTIDDNEAFPTLSIADTQVDESDGMAEIIVTMDPASAFEAKVAYATSDDTANEDDDYAAVSGTLVFPPMTTTQTIQVAIVDDIDPDSGESFDVEITNSMNADIAKETGIVTIIDDETPPILSVKDLTVNESAGVASVVVERTGGGGFSPTVFYSTSDGTALAGSDYSATSGTLSLTPGQLSATIDVALVNDDTYEETQTFSVTLSAPSDASIGVASATVTVEDDEALPNLNYANTTFDEGIGNAVVTVTKSRDSEFPVTFNFVTSQSAAKAGEDFEQTSGSATLAPGEMTFDISIPIVDDDIFEPNQLFHLRLQNVVGATAIPSQRNITIADNDAAPVFSIEDISVLESDPFGTITITRTGASQVESFVIYELFPGTATRDEDYIWNRAIIYFTENENSQTYRVGIKDDSIYEGEEYLYTRLTTVNQGTISNGEAIITILEDDTAPALSIDDLAVAEDSGNAVFTVTKSDVPTSVVSTVDFHTAPGTATADDDYTSVSGTLIFLPAELTKTITVPILDDSIFEGDPEEFQVILTNPVNAVASDPNGTATISDNDPEPTPTPTPTPTPHVEAWSFSGIPLDTKEKD